MIPVTKAFLPPQNEYQAILKRAWDSGWITNRGKLVIDLEDKLKSYLGVSNILATTNGTLPLQIAIKALKLKGEIITTPFSYVATTSSIVWEHCTPIFVDVEKDYLTIDTTLIEAAITDKTTAILATHVFGNPCDVLAIDEIAKKHKLKVIYDAAHCFGVTYNEESIFNYGDVSTCSFHATKIFHTGEGGAIFANNKELFDVLYFHHNFGHNGPLEFHGLGVNAKISELQAAMGLAVFPYMETIVSERRKIIENYLNLLSDLDLNFLSIRKNTNWNYSYFPVIFKDEKQLLHVLKSLNNKGVFPRRYFYPSLNNLPYVANVSMPVSEFVSERVLCLPLYVGLSNDDISLITECIKSHIK